MPALATGSVLLTVTTTGSVCVQPDEILVTVSVYVVVMLGFARGCAMLLALNPVAGDQLYERPATAAVPI